VHGPSKSIIAAIRTAAALLCLFASIQTRSLAQSPNDAAINTDHPVLVGYFPQWGVYGHPQYLVKNLISNSQTPLIDQINYSQGSVKDGHCSIADPNADLNYTFTADQSVDHVTDIPTLPFRGNLHQLQQLKRKFPRLRILISLEGSPASFAADAQPENLQAFVSSCVDLFIKGNFASGITVPGIFDGFDVDWEYPHQPDAANYQALLLELRRQMDAVRPGLLLSIAVGPSPRMYAGTDMAAIGKIVDQVGLMTYDFNGPWNGTTGFIAPLSAASDHDGGTVERSVAAYRAAGVPAAKLLMGLPFYGYGWHQVPETNNGLNQEGQAIRGDRPYSYIQTLFEQSTVYRDPQSQAPWLFDGDIFWTYEDPISITTKGRYAVDHQLGGLMIWELGDDTPAADLLNAAHQSLHSNPAPIQQSTSAQAKPLTNAYKTPGS
jgi:chitinase